MYTLEQHINKMKPHSDKLLAYLNGKGISMTDEGFNLTFKNELKSVTISKKCFYRFSGIACIYKEGKEKNSVETVEVTDDMFMNSYMKSVIEHNLN